MNKTSYKSHQIAKMIKTHSMKKIKTNYQDQKPKILVYYTISSIPTKIMRIS